MNRTKQRPERQALWLALAGAVVLIIGMGYGRFAYTGILPVMLNEQILSLRQGNLAASVNYAGYLIGALLLSKARPADSTRLTLASVACTLVCLALLAWVSSALGDHTYPRTGGGAECGDDDRRLAMAAPAYATPSRCAGTLFRRWNGDLFIRRRYFAGETMRRSPAHKSGLSAPRARRSSFYWSCACC